MMKVADKTESGQFATVPAAPVEKRKSPRYSFSATVDAHDILADTSIIGRLSDISRNGCYVDTISPFAMGAEVALKITAGSRSFLTDSRVVYSSNGMGMGLLFTAAEPEQVETLERAGIAPNRQRPDRSAQRQRRPRRFRGHGPAAQALEIIAL
jgi:hypothetical protein